MKLFTEDRTHDLVLLIRETSLSTTRCQFKWDGKSSNGRVVCTYVPGPTFGFVKLLASSGSHCTKWDDEQHWPAGFESRLVPYLPLPFIPTLIGLRAFDLVSSRVWWEAATNKREGGLYKWSLKYCLLGWTMVICQRRIQVFVGLKIFKYQTIRWRDIINEIVEWTIYGDFYKPRKARFIPMFCKRINHTSTAVGR